MFYFDQSIYYDLTAVWYSLLLSLVSNNSQIMEDDILNYWPTVMFRGTPCTIYVLLKELSTSFSAILTSEDDIYNRLENSKFF